MNEAFRDDLKDVVAKHSMDLSPEDLREAARRLENEAEQREESPL